MSDKAKDTAEKPAVKLILFNHGKNPFYLGKNADGSKRIFKMGESIECKDQKEYDMLRGYKGVGTAKQVAPSLQAHVSNLESQVAAKNDEIELLKTQLEKFQEKDKGGKGK